jgi:antitoxin VapB
MALNIKNREVEDLVAQVAGMTHETKTEAIRRALEERKLRLQAYGVKPKRSIREYLEKHVWPFIPPDVLGTSITKEERERLLGYGPDGLPE